MAESWGSVALVAAECQGALTAEAAIEDNVLAAFGVAANHWMVLDETPQFQGALVALLRHYEGKPEHDWLVSEARAIGRASALIHALRAGVAVDLESMARETEEEPTSRPIGLVKLWREAKGAT